MDIAHGEIVEKELDQMIERRARQGEEDRDEKEELWKESVRRYNARRREENRLAWCDYFSRLAGSLKARADEYDQTAFRVVLACRVIAGRLPLEVERREWNRSVEAPVLIDAFDWTDDRKIFSVLVWPPLESPSEDALRDHRLRASQVKAVIAKGATEMAHSTRFETDHGLRWDHDREVWTATDGFPFGGKRTHDAA